MNPRHSSARPSSVCGAWNACPPSRTSHRASGSILAIPLSAIILEMSVRAVSVGVSSGMALAPATMSRASSGVIVGNATPIRATAAASVNPPAATAARISISDPICAPFNACADTGCSPAVGAAGASSSISGTGRSANPSIAAASASGIPIIHHRLTLFWRSVLLSWRAATSSNEWNTRTPSDPGNMRARRVSSASISRERAWMSSQYRRADWAAVE